MFDRMSEKFTGIFASLRGYGRLSEKNIDDGLRDLRIALLEADVALSVVRSFLDIIRQRATDIDISKSLTPGQTLIKIINE